MFKWESSTIVNIRNNKVFEVSGGKDKDGQNIIVYNKRNNYAGQ
jgi:hypothetical protein